MIRKRVSVQAWKYGIETARKWPSKAYPDHKFVRETVRYWKAMYQSFSNESIISTERSPVLFLSHVYAGDLLYPMI